MVSKNIKASIGILTGPTSTGKTSLALKWSSEKPHIEIINADSLLVYRGLDIGTAKPQAHEKCVPHHLLDLVNPDESFTAADFVKHTQDAIEDIHRRGKRALIVGGSGFYLKALLFGLWQMKAPENLTENNSLRTNEELYQELFQKDPLSAHRIGMHDRYRLVRSVDLLHTQGKTPSQLQSELSSSMDERFELWIIDRDPKELQKRIEVRTELMLQTGLLDETQRLITSYPTSFALKAVGYAQVSSYFYYRPQVQGRKIAPGLKGLSDEIQLATRQLVKRQRTWLKGQFLKSGHPKIQKFQLEEDASKLQKIFESMYDDENMS
jgi:tRNA dimethylallyltransferase